ncbi:Hypothetical protein AT6N2_L0005 [Agrobacterium tumefaciens]|uniref:hypothetical protein n=1 Tax=Agrobacterium tumefaciens TaxID=358 RepID=UPI001ADAD1E8|nr:hypothetical protein [Agrobacterium tumefaciens]QTK80990.1 Hypothetical protein AT6N2_L0005 [Agrobacterium tumefaciens]
MDLISASKNYDGLFGLVGIILVALTAVGASIFAWFQLQRAGRQKIAEARLGWADTYRDLAVRMDSILFETTRLMQPGKLPRSIRRRRLQAEARTLAMQMLLMINPDGRSGSSLDELEMEADLGARLARAGVTVDMDYIRQQRKVLKHNWNTVKKEFWRKTYL